MKDEKARSQADLYDVLIFIVISFTKIINLYLLQHSMQCGPSVEA